MPVVIDALPGFTFGCDPELFVVNEEGEFVSAEGLLPGTKEDPYKVLCGAVQVDGMAAEFNIDPVSTFEDFDNNIVTVMKSLQKMLPKGYGLLPLPSVTFSEKVWDETPDKAKELGCTPDFNAWTGEVNPPPDAATNPRLRTTAGHLHIGWTEGESIGDIEHVTNCRDLVKQLDWYLGGWSLRMDPDPTRRRLYGKAGACRYKDYGVEYRVLSSFWLKDKVRRLAVWNRMQTAINDMSTRFFPENYPHSNDLLIKSINTSLRSRALEDNYQYPIVSI